MNKNKALKTVVLPVMIAIILVSVLILNVLIDSGTVNAQDLLKGINPNKVSETEFSDDFISVTADFSVSLFKKSFTADKNSLLSPTSVALALGMTANGAEGKTLEQFNALLGGNKIELNDINKYYYSMSSRFQKDSENKIRLANSIWYRDTKSLMVKPDFLQVNADYYKAAAYKSDFNSQDTIKDINTWVKNNTDGMIDKIIDNINADTIMYLINTVLFEAEWKDVYDKGEIRQGKFTLEDGNSISTDFMYSYERYLKKDTAQGFIKPYKGNKYSFVAILPNEGISVDEYIQSLNGKSFLDFINSKSEKTASAGIPKFKYEYEISLVDPLKNMKFTEAFDSGLANFSNMATSSDGNIYIGDVLHKTFIQVDELGTKAGAVTKVEMRTEGAVVEDNRVILDRPFIYAIIDNSSNLPLFMGTVMDPSKE